MNGITSIDHIIMLQRVYGEAAATATVVRNILAPVAGLQLDDDPDLHRRCVLVESIATYMDDALATFAPFGAVEAVATWSYMNMGVVVFSSSAAAALVLRGLARSPIGHCRAVPSLGLAAAYRFIPWAEIKVQPESKVVASSDTPPEPSRKARALAFREMCERKQMIEYHDPSCPLLVPIPVPPGMQLFSASRESLVSGPTMGQDGHLWMRGSLVKYYELGVHVSEVSVRVRQEQVGPTKIRVTPIEPIVYVPDGDY